MAKYLEIELHIGKKHEISWMLVSNKFNADKENQNTFYDSNGNSIHLKLDREKEWKDGEDKSIPTYDFYVRYLENDKYTPRTHIKSYDKLVKLIQSLSENLDKPNNS